MDDLGGFGCTKYMIRPFGVLREMDGRYEEFRGKGLSLSVDWSRIRLLIYESETYKEIFGCGHAADIQLLLLRYQHVLTYPYQ